MAKSPFYLARLAEWGAQVRMWPVGITNNNETATCIRTPDKTVMQMTGHNYVKTIQTKVDMLRTDAERLGIKSTTENPRPRFVSGGNTYEANPFDDDENEPTIQFTANKVQ